MERYNEIKIILKVIVLRSKRSPCGYAWDMLAKVSLQNRNAVFLQWMSKKAPNYNLGWLNGRGHARHYTDELEEAQPVGPCEFFHLWESLGHHPMQVGPCEFAYIWESYRSQPHPSHRLNVKIRSDVLILISQGHNGSQTHVYLHEKQSTLSICSDCIPFHYVLAFVESLLMRSWKSVGLLLSPIN